MLNVIVGLCCLPVRLCPFGLLGRGCARYIGGMNFCPWGEKKARHWHCSVLFTLFLGMCTYTCMLVCACIYVKKEVRRRKAVGLRYASCRRYLSVDRLEMELHLLLYIAASGFVGQKGTKNDIHLFMNTADFLKNPHNRVLVSSSFTCCVFVILLYSFYCTY